MIRQTEWMSSLLSKIAASKVVNLDTEEKLDSLRRTVGVVQHHDAATGTERQAVADDYRWIELFKYLSTFLFGCHLSIIGQNFDLDAYSLRMNRAVEAGGSSLNLTASFQPPFREFSKASFVISNNMIVMFINRGATTPQI